MSKPGPIEKVESLLSKTSRTKLIAATTGAAIFLAYAEKGDDPVWCLGFACAGLVAYILGQSYVDGMTKE